MDWFHTISTHTTLLTPNRRLAAVILDKYSDWQKDASLQCWPTLDVLPLYPSWLERTLKSLLILDLSYQPLLLTSQQEHILWEKILRESPDNEILLHISETTKLAKSAWETLKRWNVTLDDPRLGTTEDSRAFLRWATQFHKLCQKKNWIDQHSFADKIKEKIKDHPEHIPKHLVLVGFTDIVPQYLQLFTFLEKHGCSIEHISMPARNQTISCISLTDHEKEIQTMAKWAKRHYCSQQQIGCIVPNLEDNREQVVRIFSTIFKKHEFNISAGKSLSDYPVVYDALQFLHLPLKKISLANVSHFLKSPFLGESEKERNKRSLFDLRLYQFNIPHISLAILLDQNNKLNFASQCPALAKRLHNAFDKLSLKTKLSIHKWIFQFTEILAELGWPGERSLNSHEYQVVQNAWLPLLNQYASFSHLFEPISYKEALHYLTLLAKDTIFQPESPKAPVQVLGLLEAADIPFNYSWVLGLDDSVWPPRPKPNPLIPLQLQKSLNMPNASAERELNYCQLLTRQLQNSAEHIIFSHPLQKEDMELRPSALLKSFPILTEAELSLETTVSPIEKVFATRQLDTLNDELAPAISTNDLLGGVKIFKTQAECPFKAFAELRLHAKKIDDPTTGLRKLDRGNIMHKALEFLWSQLKDSAQLIKLTDSQLNSLIHDCAARALNEIVDLAAATNKRYLVLECQRVEKLLAQWLAIEKTRSPFKVIALEKEMTTQIGKITAHFRLDRIDELSGIEIHNKLLIDYKTGKQINKNDWFGERLDEPQLPLYCIANPDEIIGIAFAKINPSKMELIGASRAPIPMDSIDPLATIPQADATLWTEQLVIWKQTLEQLGDAFYQGKADVNPKNPNIACRLCGLHSLCRIHELNLLNPINESDD